MAIKKRDKENQWGKRLKAVMQERAVTNAVAAKKASVSPSVISSWTNDSVLPSTNLLNLKQLCNYLDISFSWVLTGEKEKIEQEPTLAEIFEEVPYFDGLARIRIDRLMPREKKNKK